MRAKHVRGRPPILPKPAPTTLSIDRLALPARLCCHGTSWTRVMCCRRTPWLKLRTACCVTQSLPPSRVLSSAVIPRSEHRFYTAVGLLLLYYVVGHRKQVNWGTQVTGYYGYFRRFFPQFLSNYGSRRTCVTFKTNRRQTVYNRCIEAVGTPTLEYTTRCPKRTGVACPRAT